MRRELSWTLATLVLAFFVCGKGAAEDSSVALQQKDAPIFPEKALIEHGSRPAIVKADEGVGESEDGGEKGNDKDENGEDDEDGEPGEDKKGDDEEDEEKGEEEGEEGNPDTGISIMLLGSIAFMMSLFYVTNTNDPDFQVYSWEVISKTISIFSAVLLFQATQSVALFFLLGKGVEEEGAEEEVSEEEEEHMMWGELVVAGLMMVFWYGCLQFTLAYLTGAIEICPKKGEEDGQATESVSHHSFKMGTLSDEQKEEFENMHVNLKCFGVLIGHIAGFAAINALGVVQQMVSSEKSLCLESETMKHIAAFVVCGCSFWVLTAVHKVTDVVRNKVAMGDDGQIDEAEEMWEEETTEVEDDVIGLAISFLFIQAVRFWVGKSLPNVEGEDEDAHGFQEVVILFCVGVGMMLLLLLKAQYLPVADPRKNAQLGNIVSMSFAWCLYFSVYWFISDELSSLAEGMLSEVIIALIVTATGLGLIAAADKMADAEWTAPEIDAIIRGEVVTAIGILIGFSWEKNFDKAVTCIALSTLSEDHPEFPIFTKLVMSILCVGLTVPAWWIHILPPQLKRKEDSDRRMAVDKMNYMIKFPHKYQDWPCEVDEVPSGAKEPLIAAEAHGGHGGGHHEDGHHGGHHGEHHGHGGSAAHEPDRRKVLKEGGLSPEQLGHVMLKVDEKRDISRQEFQCLLNEGNYCCKYDKETNEWIVADEATMEDRLTELGDEAKRLVDEKKKLRQDFERQRSQLAVGRLEEAEEHNRRLQKHIHGYGNDIEELKKMSDQLHALHHENHWNY